MFDLIASVGQVAQNVMMTKMNPLIENWIKECCFTNSTVNMF